MNKCPQCGQRQKSDEYRCFSCGSFYSKLDEILAAEAAEKEKTSFKGRLKAIKKADDPIQTLMDELKLLKENIPSRSFFTLLLIFVFIFTLVVSVL